MFCATVSNGNVTSFKVIDSGTNKNTQAICYAIAKLVLSCTVSKKKENGMSK